jgi:hypothetical protein
MKFEGSEMKQCVNDLFKKWTDLCGNHNPSPEEGGAVFRCILESYLEK